MRIVAFDMGRRNFAFAEMIQSPNETWGNVVFFDTHDFNNEKPSVMFRNLISYLNQFRNIWENVEIVLIEQQLSSLNIQAARLACHVAAYFYHCYPGVKVFDYPAVYKTKLLGEQKKTTHRERKQFAIQKVWDHYSYADPVLWEWINTLKKKDDVADCILMCATFPLSPFYKEIQVNN